jgi:hypothetical protein
VDPIANVSCDCGSGVAGVDDAFISCDWDFDVVFVEGTPVFFHDCDEALFIFCWNVVADLQMFVEIGLISDGVEFDFDKLGVAVVVGKGWLGAFSYYMAYCWLVKEFEIGVDVR